MERNFVHKKRFPFSSLEDKKGNLKIEPGLFCVQDRNKPIRYIMTNKLLFVFLNRY